MNAFKSLGLLAALAACQPVAGERAGVPPLQARTETGPQSRAPDTCGARRYRDAALGRPRDAIPALGVSGRVRVIPHGALVTQDYDPHRMNFHLDRAGRVARLSCG